MPTPYRDRSGRTLQDYPRPSVAVDTAVLTLAPANVPGELAELSVLLVRQDPPEGQDRRRASWGLPGTFLHPGETLADTVLRCLRDKAGVAGKRPSQLRVFDAPGRDDRGWVLSVAHLDVVPFDVLDRERAKESARIVPIRRRVPMRYDHATIARIAAERLRTDYAHIPDPWRLLGESFTMSDLRAVHEAVISRPLQKDTFRRSMLPLLRPLPHRVSRGPGRPAGLFSRHKGGPVVCLCPGHTTRVGAQSRGRWRKWTPCHSRRSGSDRMPGPRRR